MQVCTRASAPSRRRVGAPSLIKGANNFFVLHACAQWQAQPRPSRCDTCGLQHNLCALFCCSSVACPCSSDLTRCKALQTSKYSMTTLQRRPPRSATFDCSWHWIVARCCRRDTLAHVAASAGSGCRRRGALRCAPVCKALCTLEGHCNHADMPLQLVRPSQDNAIAGCFRTVLRALKSYVRGMINAVCHCLPHMHKFAESRPADDKKSAASETGKKAEGAGKAQRSPDDIAAEEDKK